MTADAFLVQRYLASTSVDSAFSPMARASGIVPRRLEDVP